MLQLVVPFRVVYCVNLLNIELQNGVIDIDMIDRSTSRAQKTVAGTYVNSTFSNKCLIDNCYSVSMIIIQDIRQLKLISAMKFGGFGHKYKRFFIGWCFELHSESVNHASDHVFLNLGCVLFFCDLNKQVRICCEDPLCLYYKFSL